MIAILYAAATGAGEIEIYNRSGGDGDGGLAHVATVPCAGGPMWLCTNAARTRLYACTVETTELVSFSVDQATGMLTEIGRIKYPDAGSTDPHGDKWTGSPAACYISCSGGFLYTAFCEFRGFISVPKPPKNKNSPSSPLCPPLCGLKGLRLTSVWVH